MAKLRDKLQPIVFDTAQSLPQSTALARMAPPPAVSSWGMLPMVCLLMAGGLVLIAHSFADARAAVPSAELYFWLGILTIVVTATVRLVLPNVARRERMAVVVAMGTALYMMKVMHNPIAFSFPDELTHYRNVAEVLEHGRLFTPNPGVPATANYPALPSLTAAIAMMSGLSIFHSGIMLIMAARVVLMLTLFLLFERLSGSARIAGLAMLFYIGNSNFAFWSAQFAYESLALPMASVVLLAVVTREYTTDRLLRQGLWIATALGILLVVVTHHMTGFLLVAVLWILALAVLAISRGQRRGILVLAVWGLITAGSWVWFVSPTTVGYLGPVLGGALQSALELVLQRESDRKLFQSSSTGYVAPLWERIVGLGSVIVALPLALLGLWRIWREYRHSIFVCLLGLGGMLYFPVVSMRLTAAGWETSNRASAFLFVGLALLLALSVGVLRTRRHSNWPAQALIIPLVALMVLGGVIAGWPSKVRLARPYLIATEGAMIQPAGLYAAHWLRAAYGTDNRVAIDAANAKYMLAYGEQHPFTRTKYGVRAMFFSDNIGRTERRVIRKTGVRFLVVDERLVSWDHVSGVYYGQSAASLPAGQSPYLEPDAIDKFAQQEYVDRIFDSGDLSIYDVQVFLDAPSDARP